MDDLLLPNVNVKLRRPIGHVILLGGLPWAVKVGLSLDWLQLLQRLPLINVLVPTTGLGYTFASGFDRRLG